MKNTIFILMAVVLGMTACNDSEQVIPNNQNEKMDTEAVASIATPSQGYPTLRSVEQSILSNGGTELPLPSGYVPQYSNYMVIKYFYNSINEEHFYVYEFPSAAEVDPDADIECRSLWHSNEGACYNPGNECYGYIGLEDGKPTTIIICC